MHRTEWAALTGLTDDALVSRLSSLCAEGHVLTARMIVHLIEVEERRLDLRAACTSMFDFCQRRLRMSEGAAFRRITAARLVKRFPMLLARIERGELHLSTLVLLRPHLTEANVEELAAAAAGKTQRQVEELLARLAPKPDVPSAIVVLCPLSNGAGPSLFSDAEASETSEAAEAAAPPSAPRARIEPLSEARYRVQLTADADLKAKLERACDLMRHRNPSGDLSVVIDAAMDLLLVKLEKERLGKVKAPRVTKATRSQRAPKTPATLRSGSRSDARRPRSIPVAVRRAVFERDGEQCTFIDPTGERCPQRGHLELDHVEPRALGGTDDASNLRVRCRAHNRLAAEDVFGKAQVEKQIDFRQRRSHGVAATEPAPTPAAAPAAPPAREILEIVARGLHNLGFSKPDVRRAVDHVAQHRIAQGEVLDAHDLLRGAIAALT